MTDLLYTMALIRAFEETILEMFKAGQLHGTTHCCIGQEANAVAVASQLQPGDFMFSNHRCHGHYIARTGNVEGLFAELLGLPSGICGGRGGSQHLCDPKWRFYTNGVQGNLAPVAAGMALAERDSENIGVLWLGDGTMGQGVVYETLNLVALWKLPLLIVVEMNGIAQSTPTETAMANVRFGSLRERAAAFGIATYDMWPGEWGDPKNSLFLAVVRVRTRRLPAFVTMHCNRLCPHSKGDDYRDISGLYDPISEVPTDVMAAARAEIQRIKEKLCPKA